MLFNRINPILKLFRKVIPLAALVLLALPVSLRAQQTDEFDEYKLRLDAFWFHSGPTGTVQGQGDTVPVDFSRDLRFDSYSTFAGKIDWKFTHKNHFYVSISPLYSSKQTILTKDITFQGQTFEAGTSVNSSLHALFVAPGYQYDIIRRKRGHLGLGIQMDLYDTHAKISGIVADSEGSISATAKGSLLAPIPVAGPEFRLYLTDSPRLFVEGNVYGMYLFGYGNFVSSSGTLGVTVTKHLSLNAGYQLGSHLFVTETSNRVGLRLTQKGALAGLEYSF